MKHFKNLWSQKNEIRDYNTILIMPDLLVKINPDNQVTLPNSNISIDSPVFVDMELFLKIYDTKFNYRYENDQLIRQDGIKYNLKPVDVSIEEETLIKNFDNCYHYESIKELYFNINKKYQGTTREHLYSVCFNRNEVVVTDVRFLSIKYTDSQLPEQLVIPFKYFQNLKTDFDLAFDEKIVRIKADNEIVYFKKDQLLNDDYPDYHSVIPDYIIDPELEYTDKFLKFLNEAKKLKLEFLYFSDQNKIIASNKPTVNDTLEFDDDAMVMEINHEISNSDKMSKDFICFDLEVTRQATTITDKIYINAHNRPSIAKNKDDKYLFLVMPLRG
ncbi:MAG: hypothetical protein WC002_10010 [Candidatus Muiribacteriota bacterium]